MRFLKITIISILVFVFFAAGSAQSTMIDTFDTYQRLRTKTVDDSTDTSGASYIGSSRYMSLDITYNPLPGGRWSTLESNSGSLSLSSGDQVDTESLLRWDDNGGGLGADLTDGGIDDRFVISITSINATVTLGMTVSDGTNTATYSTNTSSTGDLEFLYANFTGGAVDWENIDSIEFWFNGSSSADITLDFIETGNSGPVPEPSTMLLLGAGLIGLAGVSMKKTKI
jgi:hypothetical protein